jgi:uncharacterized protein YgiM (DUF1202 family)
MRLRLFTGLIVAFILFSIPAALAGPEEFPFTGVINTNQVNIRAGQNLNFESLGIFQKDDKVVVLQKSYSWYKIKLPQGTPCYVHRKFVHLLRDQVGEINGNHVNIRARASTDSAVIGQLNNLTKVMIVESQESLEEWYRIEPLEGLYGWVQEEFVEFQSNDVPPPVVVQLPTRNIYEIKRQEEALKKQEEEQRRQEEEKQKVTLRGVIVLIGGSQDPDIRHQITSDDGKVFYLKGYRSMLDGFLNHRVQIEGLPQADAGTAQPVLLVTKIVLVL